MAPGERELSKMIEIWSNFSPKILGVFINLLPQRNPGHFKITISGALRPITWGWAMYIMTVMVQQAGNVGTESRKMLVLAALVSAGMANYRTMYYCLPFGRVWYFGGQFLWTSNCWKRVFCSCEECDNIMNDTQRLQLGRWELTSQKVVWSGVSTLVFFTSRQQTMLSYRETMWAARPRTPDAAPLQWELGTLSFTPSPQSRKCLDPFSGKGQHFDHSSVRPMPPKSVSRHHSPNAKACGCKSKQS